MVDIVLPQGEWEPWARMGGKNIGESDIFT